MTTQMWAAWAAAAAVAVLAGMVALAEPADRFDARLPPGVSNPLAASDRWDRGAWETTGAVPARPPSAWYEDEYDRLSWEAQNDLILQGP